MRPGLILLVTALLSFLVDQASKVWVLEVLDLPARGVIHVAPPYLVFVMAWNEGINFGIPFGGRWFLVALAVGISGALAWWVLTKNRGVLALAGGLVVGGALGNALDRVLYGAVADFLNMSCCGVQNPFSFNVADTAIFLGAALIIWKA
ncbi:MAG: signal peptidase II [Pseudomonadota bacterium]